MTLCIPHDEGDDDEVFDGGEGGRSHQVCGHLQDPQVRIFSDQGKEAEVQECQPQSVGLVFWGLDHRCEGAKYAG